jgi:hypothetical protein
MAARPLNPNFVSVRNGVIVASDVMCRLAPIEGRQFTIYAAINKINSKVYVGLTSKALKVRRGHHLSASRAGSTQAFHRAIRKHGETAFDFYTVLRLPSYELALREETDLIATLRPEYNMTSGGEGIRGFRHSDETKRKISRAAQGRSGHSPAQAEAFKRTGARWREKRKKPVLCENTGVIYWSLTEAARACGLTTTQITRACRGVGSRHGLKFRYVEASSG